MKQRITRQFCLALALMLTAVPVAGSLAEGQEAFGLENYVSLAELREEAKDGWHQTYTVHGREVTVNVDFPWFPDADACPVIEVEGWGKQVDKAVLEGFIAGGKSAVYQFECSMSVDVIEEDQFVKGQNGSYRGKTVTPQELRFYNGDIPTETPENVELSYEEFLGKVSRDLELLSELTLDDFRIESLHVEGVTYKAKEKNGELIQGDPITKTGLYWMNLKQLFHGIPIVGAAGEWTETPRGELRYLYYSPKHFSFTLACSEEVGVRAPDVPLLSFGSMKRVLEKQMEEGKLRGVDGMEFGYMAFYEGKKANRAWVLMPVWRVEGGYTNDPKKETVMPYHDPRDRDGSLTVPLTYGNYYYSAQTGEMLPTALLTQKDNQLPAGEIIAWEDLR